jgi:hypothetical protein
LEYVEKHQINLFLNHWHCYVSIVGEVLKLVSTHMCNCCRSFVTFHHHIKHPMKFLHRILICRLLIFVDLHHPQACSNNNKHFLFHSIANTYRLANSTSLQDVQQQKCSTIKREHDALNIGETKTKNMKHIDKNCKAYGKIK